MPIITNAAGALLAAVLSLASLLHAALPTTAAPAPASGPEPVVFLTPPDLPAEQPLGASPRKDGGIVALSRLDMPAGAAWETVVSAETFTVHVKIGELAIVLADGDGVAHLDDARQALAAGSEVVLRADDWLTAEFSAVVAVRNLTAQPASAMLFRGFPLPPPIAPELLAQSATGDDAFWRAAPRGGTDGDFRRAMPRDETRDEFWRTMPDQQSPGQLQTL